MKKGKVFSKRHIVSAVLVLCLAAAVWFNMKYSSFDYSNGQTSSNNDKQYYDANSNLGEAVETQGGVTTILTARNDRNKTRTSAVEELKAKLDSVELDNADKLKVLEEYSKMTQDIANEASIETVIKAKGFSDALVMISENGVTVIVPSNDLLTSETLQIQDAVTSQIKIDLEKIKIIAVK